MNSTDLGPTTVHQLVTDTILGPDFRRATFGGAIRGGAASLWVRIVVRPIDLRSQRQLQFSYFDRTKCITRNYPVTEGRPPLEEALALGFAGIHLSSGTEEIDIRTSKKGKVQIGRRSTTATTPEPIRAHNRAKDVPLPEGRADRSRSSIAAAGSATSLWLLTTT